MSTQKKKKTEVADGVEVIDAEVTTEETTEAEEVTDAVVLPQEQKKPWYKNWKVLAAIGAGVAAIAGTIALGVKSKSNSDLVNYMLWEEQQKELAAGGENEDDTDEDETDETEENSEDDES